MSENRDKLKQDIWRAVTKSKLRDDLDLQRQWENALMGRENVANHIMESLSSMLEKGTDYLASLRVPGTLYSDTKGLLEHANINYVRWKYLTPEKDKEQLLDSYVDGALSQISKGGPEYKKQFQLMLDRNDLPKPDDSLEQIVQNADAPSMFAPLFDAVVENARRTDLIQEDFEIQKQYWSGLGERLVQNDAELLTRLAELEVELDGRKEGDKVVVDVFLVEQGEAQLRQSSSLSDERPLEKSWYQDFQQSGRLAVDFAKAAMPFLSEEDQEVVSNVMTVADSTLNVIDGAMLIYSGNFLAGGTSLLRGAAGLMGIKMPDANQKRFEMTQKALIQISQQVEATHKSVVKNRELILENKQLIEGVIGVLDVEFGSLNEKFDILFEAQKTTLSAIEEGVSIVLEQQAEVANQMLDEIRTSFNKQTMAIAEQLEVISTHLSTQIEEVRSEVLTNRYAINKNYWRRIEWLQSEEIFLAEQRENEVDSLIRAWIKFGIFDEHDTMQRDVWEDQVELSAYANRIALDISKDPNFIDHERQFGHPPFLRDDRRENYRQVLRKASQTDGWKFVWPTYDSFFSYLGNTAGRLYYRLLSAYFISDAKGGLQEVLEQMSDIPCKVELSPDALDTSMTTMFYSVHKYHYFMPKEEARIVAAAYASLCSSSISELQGTQFNRSNAFNPLFALFGMRIFAKINFFLAGGKNEDIVDDQTDEVLRMVQLAKPDWEMLEQEKLLLYFANLPTVFFIVNRLKTKLGLGDSFQADRRTVYFVAEKANRIHGARRAWLASMKEYPDDKEWIGERDEFRLILHIAMSYEQLNSDIDFEFLKTGFQMLMRINYGDKIHESPWYRDILAQYDECIEFTNAFRDLPKTKMRRFLREGHERPGTNDYQELKADILPRFGEWFEDFHKGDKFKKSIQRFDRRDYQKRLETNQEFFDATRSKEPSEFQIVEAITEAWRVFADAV